MQQSSSTTLLIKDILQCPGFLREIGHDLRASIRKQWETFDIVELDFEGETVAFGSLFDEIAKLFDEFPKEEVKRRLQFVDIDPWDKNLIAHLAKLRLDRQKKQKKG